MEMCLRLSQYRGGSCNVLARELPWVGINSQKVLGCEVSHLNNLFSLKKTTAEIIALLKV